MSTTLQPAYPDVRVLDRSQFASLDELREATKSANSLNLILVDPIDLSEVLAWLGNDDDVCLRDSPPELISHRANALRLRLSSVLDPLTHALSRQRFDELLCRAATDVREDRPVSLLLCDLDHFKSLNDEYGHQTGDQVLKLVSSTLREHADPSSSVGRIGGERFCLLCYRDPTSALELAEELRRRVANCETDDGASATMSVGVATATTSMDGHQLLQWADQALYSAKAQGRDRSVSYDDMESRCRTTGSDVEAVGLENQARVLADRVAGFIAMRSRKLIGAARQEADIDGLTHCYNRRYLDRRLAGEFASRDDEPLSVAFLDLDHFGQVNKTHGWPTGDKLLVEVCKLIRDNLRSSDWVGRYGGEEFCVIMPHTTGAEARTILERIRATVEGTEFFCATQSNLVPMSLSVGIATALSVDASHEQLLDRASAQALRAKRGGRNQVCLSSDR